MNSRILELSKPVFSRTLPPGARLLGQGWQHTAYDLNNGRVHKQPRHFLPLFLSVCRAKPSDRPLGSRNVVRETRHLMREAVTSLKGLRQREGLYAPAMFANPVIAPNGAYQQDKVYTISHAIRASGPDAVRRIIDDYISFQLRCWSYGFGDCGFDFAINSGIDARGKVVQIDLGELVFSRTVLEAAIRNRNWLHQISFTRHLGTREAQTYFREQAERRLTLRTLEANWESRLPDRVITIAPLPARPAFDLSAFLGEHPQRFTLEP